METECGRKRFNAEDGQVVSEQNRQRVVRFEDGSLRSCALSKIFEYDFQFDDDCANRAVGIGEEHQAVLPHSMCSLGRCVCEDRLCDAVDPFENMSAETLLIIRQNEKKWRLL